MSNFLQRPTDDSYYISDTLFVEPRSGNETVRVYNVLGGKIKTKPYVEISGTPKKPSKGFECKVRDIVKKTGFCKSDDMLKKSFFTPLDNGEKSANFDSSILLRLTTNYFILCLLNCKERKIGMVYLEDLYYDNKFMEAFQMVNAEEVSCANFQKRIQGLVDWRNKMIRFNQRVFGGC
ncbi:MAG: hypothetical protein KBT14_03130 [Proteobacteria bacterium]|nr:hypothetical protein [Candidatus Enterousia onthequi]